MSEIDKKKLRGNQLRTQFPGKIPVFITPFKDSRIEIKGDVFMCDRSHTVIYLIMKIKERITNLKPEEGLYAFIGNSILNGGTTIAELDNKYTQKNGFLDITIARENCFGFSLD